MNDAVSFIVVIRLSGVPSIAWAICSSEHISRTNGESTKPRPSPLTRTLGPEILSDLAAYTPARTGNQYSFAGKFRHVYSSAVIKSWDIK
jgi:hypothetical protein